MLHTYQNSLSPARINIKLDLQEASGNLRKELPLKILVLGNFTQKTFLPSLKKRERISVSKITLDGVIKELAPEISVDNERFYFRSMRDFSPENIVNQSPMLSRFLAMRNLLKELKANVVEDISFRKDMTTLMQNESLLKTLQVSLQTRVNAKEEEVCL